MLRILKRLASMFTKEVEEEIPQVEVIIQKTRKKVKREKKISPKSLKSSNPYKEGDKVNVVHLARTLKCVGSNSLADYYKENAQKILGYAEVTGVISDCIVIIKPETFTELVYVHVSDIALAYTQMDSRRTRF